MTPMSASFGPYIPSLEEAMAAFTTPVCNTPSARPSCGVDASKTCSALSTPSPPGDQPGGPTPLKTPAVLFDQEEIPSRPSTAVLGLGGLLNLFRSAKGPDPKVNHNTSTTGVSSAVPLAHSSTARVDVRECGVAGPSNRDTAESGGRSSDCNDETGAPSSSGAKAAGWARGTGAPSSPPAEAGGASGTSWSVPPSPAVTSPKALSGSRGSGSGHGGFGGWNSPGGGKAPGPGSPHDVAAQYKSAVAQSTLEVATGPKRPYLLGGTSTVNAASGRAAAATKGNPAASAVAPSGNFRIWRPNGGSTPKAAPLPTALETSTLLAPAPLPPAPDIAAGYLRPVPRRFKRGSAGGSAENDDNVEELVLSPATGRASSVSSALGGSAWIEGPESAGAGVGGARSPSHPFLRKSSAVLPSPKEAHADQVFSFKNNLFEK